MGKKTVVTVYGDRLVQTIAQAKIVREVDRVYEFPVENFGGLVPPYKSLFESFLVRMKTRKTDVKSQDIEYASNFWLRTGMDHFFH